MRSLPFIRIVGAMLALTSVAQAGQEPVTGEIVGYIEHRQQVVLGLDKALATLPLVDFDELGFHPDRVFGTTEKIRPTAKLHFGERATLVTTAEAHSYHLFDERTQDDIWDYVSLERLYLSLSTDVVDLTLGKQVLNWGHGLLLNPTAPLNARPPQDLRAELEGLWAVRTLVALGDESNLTLAAAVREDAPSDPVVIGRYDVTTGTTDLAALLSWNEPTNDMTLGFEVKGDIEDGPSLWAETTATINLDDPDSYSFEAEVGLDYTFDVYDGLYVAAEYIHHGSGSDGDYLQSALGGGRRSVLLGKDYALLLMRETFSGDWQLQLLSLLNVRDPSGTTSVQLTWLPTGSLEVVLGANVTYGSEGGEYALTIPDTVTVPGLGTIPTPEAYRGLRVVPIASLFLWARYYF